MFRISTLVLSLWPFVAGAQPTKDDLQLLKQFEGTLLTVAHTVSVEGKIEGCGIEFAVMTPDWATKKGALARMVGSYYIRAHPKSGIGYSLKLGIFDGLNKQPAPAPNYGFARAGTGEVSARGKRVAAETTGFILVVGGLDSGVANTLESIMDKQELFVGFNRAPGQQDVIAKVDLTVLDTSVSNEGKVVRTKGEKTVDEFSLCIKDLLAAVDPKSSKTQLPKAQPK